ncbi:MAG: hypothetical protein ACXAD7_11905 [Candidatus Kariarchaeaceae archaeon]
MCKQVLVNLNTIEVFSLFDYYLLYETYLSLGLGYIYDRKFDKVKDLIEDLQQDLPKFKENDLISNEAYLDIIFIPSILSILYNFTLGKTREMKQDIAYINEWIESVRDPWARGFFYNLNGISLLQQQNIGAAEIILKTSYKYFRIVHDLRGFTGVGANLGVSLLSQGYRQEGREYIESILDPMVRLNNFTQAITNMLTVSKSYLDENLVETARGFLEWAEELISKASIKDPATYSLFCYLYSKLREFEKADRYLRTLRSMAKIPEDRMAVHPKEKGEDVYTLLWYYNAAAVNAMANGNLQWAQSNVEEGIEKADLYAHYDTSLELSTIAIEIILKRYLIERSEEHLRTAIELCNDIGTLILNLNNPYYTSMFNILTAYLYLAIANNQEALTYFQRAKEITHQLKHSLQHEEINLFNERNKFLYRASPGKFLKNPLFEPFFKYWLSDEAIPIFFTMEAIRLLGNLQFQQAEVEKTGKKGTVPLMIILLDVGGVPTFTYRFTQDSTHLDEVLVGGFLGALTSFSQELFGGGMLNRIDQDNYILLLENLSSTNLLLLIVEEETYDIRKKFKQFSQELARMNVVEYLGSGIYLTEDDPQYKIILDLIELVFL